MMRESDIAALEGDALRLGLRRLFGNSNFYYSDLQNLLQICNIKGDARIMNALHALHCVPYSDMNKETKERLFATVLTLFTEETFNLELIDHLADEVAYQKAGQPSVMRSALAGMPSFNPKAIGP